jgi:hypothetical protein
VLPQSNIANRHCERATNSGSHLAFSSWQLPDMLKAKDGDFFVTDWLRNRNTLEYIGIWEKVNNPDFNYGEFATIRNNAGLNNVESKRILKG